MSGDTAYYRKRYAERRARGRCISCDRPAPFGARCAEHAAKARETFRRYREKLLRDAGRIP